jgi:hypothetical protein
MDQYNPERAPEPESWLELDEQERTHLIETWHRVARIKLPKSRYMPYYTRSSKTSLPWTSIPWSGRWIAS